MSNSIIETTVSGIVFKSYDTNSSFYRFESTEHDGSGNVVVQNNGLLQVQFTSNWRSDELLLCNTWEEAVAGINKYFKDKEAEAKTRKSIYTSRYEELKNLSNS